MSRRRFYSPPEAFNLREKQVILGVEEARHLREVLRLKAGDRVSVFDGLGNEYAAVIVKAMRDSSILEILELVETARRESPLKLTLALALLKGDKFDLVVQKATELGVNEVVPLMTTFADIRLRDSADAIKRVARWQRIALEAAKQSGRAVLPTINAPVDFRALVVAASDDDTLRLLFAEKGGVAMENLPSFAPRVTALIGSEGGWSDEEVGLARDHGWKIVTLGGRTMRAETAAIAITTLMQHRYGDLK